MPLGYRVRNTAELPNNVQHPQEMQNPVDIRQWYLDRSIDTVVYGDFVYKLNQTATADYGSVCLPGPGYTPYWPVYVTQVVTDLRNYAPKVYADYKSYLNGGKGSMLRLSGYKDDKFEVSADTDSGIYSACYPMPKPEMWREAVWSLIGRPF